MKVRRIFGRAGVRATAAAAALAVAVGVLAGTPTAGMGAVTSSTVPIGTTSAPTGASTTSLPLTTSTTAVCVAATSGCPGTTTTTTRPPTTTTTRPPTTTTTTQPCVNAGQPQGTAFKDLIIDRDKKMPCEGTVVVGTGDSITSAHIQTAVDDMCGSTPSDAVRVKFGNTSGNDGVKSYLGVYAQGNNRVRDYYNFARTGYGVGDMLAAAPGPDACKNIWPHNAGGPAQMAASTITWAKSKNLKAYFVSTGGVNDTNWSDILTNLIQCFVLQLNARTNTFKWVPDTPGTQVVPDGGRCQGTMFGTEYTYVIPAFGGAGQKWAAMKGPLQKQIEDIIKMQIAAGADRVVWVKYPDITLANIQLRAVVRKMLGLKARLLTLPVSTPIVPVLWAPAARQLIKELNDVIQAAVDAVNDPKVSTLDPALTVATEFQTTGVGGSPHPSVAGHKAIAAKLKPLLP